ncbi:uncharacterized protein LOC62_01G000665 [Vanrija pseudolonga]|uniref:Mid2 domain-containing protein n=1 Tax=Vanrija pseudolonga TaxID=143232 RepID=A0AAF1BIE8_9TREE|nr:hypothetical protein LOC62_01G000665 [Vanrija pseudolonga]
MSANTTNTTSTTAPAVSSASAAAPQPSLSINYTVPNSEYGRQCAHNVVTYAGTFPPFEVSIMDHNTSIKTWGDLRSQRGTLQYTSPKKGGIYYLVLKDSRNATATSRPPLYVIEGGNCGSGPDKGVLAGAISGAIVGALFVAAVLYLGWNRLQKRKAEHDLAARQARATADLRAGLAAQALRPNPGREEAGVVRVQEEGEDVAPAYDEEGKPPLYQEEGDGGPGEGEHTPISTPVPTTYPPRRPQ